MPTIHDNMKQRFTDWNAESCMAISMIVLTSNRSGPPAKTSGVTYKHTAHEAQLSLMLSYHLVSKKLMLLNDYLRVFIININFVLSM